MSTKMNGAKVPGTDVPKPLSLAEVKDFVKRDLGACLNLLDALYRDQATCDMLADILYGRYLNAKHKRELEAQEKLDV